MSAERQRPIGDLLRDSIDDERVTRIKNHVNERRQVSLPARRPQIYALAAVAAAVCVVFITLVIVLDRRGSAPEQPGPVRLSSGALLEQITAPEAASSPRRFELDDGSELELEPGTGLRAIENTGRQVSLVLGEGSATFTIASGGPRRWQVDAGLASVIVVGTVFTVRRAPDRVTITVDRGAVQVLSEHVEGRELVAGTSLVIQQEGESTPSQQVSESIEQVPLPDAEATDGGLGRSWQRLAREGNYDEAYTVLGPGGLRQETESAVTMDQLMIIADVARLSGHPHDAVSPLEIAIERFPGDRQTAVAAFTLGRLEADVLGRPGRAVHAFQRCLELGPPRALEEDAHGRLAETYARSGDSQAARRAAISYLRRYPNGRRAEALRRWIEPR